MSRPIRAILAEVRPVARGCVSELVEAVENLLEYGTGSCDRCDRAFPLRELTIADDNATIACEGCA